MLILRVLNIIISRKNTNPRHPLINPKYDPNYTRMQSTKKHINSLRFNISTQQLIHPTFNTPMSKHVLSHGFARESSIYTQIYAQIQGHTQ